MLNYIRSHTSQAAARGRVYLKMVMCALVVDLRKCSYALLSQVVRKCFLFPLNLSHLLKPKINQNLKPTKIYVAFMDYVPRTVDVLFRSGRPICRQNGWKFQTRFGNRNATKSYLKNKTTLAHTHHRPLPNSADKQHPYTPLAIVVGSFSLCLCVTHLPFIEVI